MVLFCSCVCILIFITKQWSYRSFCSCLYIFLTKQWSYCVILQSCVVSLFKLLVREKGDTRDSKGVYLISPNKMAPEMYELTCKTTEERKTWIKTLRKAIENCPEEGEHAPPF